MLRACRWFRRGFATALISLFAFTQKILIDPKGEVTERYQVREFPTTVLIGRDFLVRELLVGVQPLRDQALRGRVMTLVHETTAP